MITKLKYIVSDSFLPYENLALEEYLLYFVKKDECILYLWQNKNTVVIGKNQNAFKECKVEELLNSGGHIVRRLSGGGAVYHDLGNLNFTFLVRNENYNVEKQLEIILRAVKKFSINAEKTGRNDITIDGKKFSGNAFFKSGDFRYHHGTLLVNVNIGELSKYLNVSMDKLKSKGVTSVKSRVTNLNEYNKNLTVDNLKLKLIESFEEVYGLKAECINAFSIDKCKIEELKNKFLSNDFIFGKKIKSEYEFSKRFSWGDIQFRFNLSGGFVKDLIINSDAMNVDIIEEISSRLKGCLFSSREFCSKLDELKSNNDIILNLMIDDIKELIHTNLN